MSASAEIIPFPARIPPAWPTAAGPMTDDPGRLARALALLDLALAEQRAAVTVWQDALATLGSSLAGLEDSLRGYDNRLAGLRDRTDVLHAKALHLEAWADTALAGSVPGAHALSPGGSR